MLSPPLPPPLVVARPYVVAMNNEIEEKGMGREESRVVALELLSLTDQARRNRAKTLEILGATARKNRLIHARVKSHSGWDVPFYDVMIDLLGSWFQCTCADHGQTAGPCKHVAAVLLRYTAPAPVEVSAQAKEVEGGVQGR